MMASRCLLSNVRLSLFLLTPEPAGTEESLGDGFGRKTYQRHSSSRKYCRGLVISQVRNCLSHLVCPKQSFPHRTPPRQLVYIRDSDRRLQRLAGVEDLRGRPVRPRIKDNDGVALVGSRVFGPGTLPGKLHGEGDLRDRVGRFLRAFPRPALPHFQITFCRRQYSFLHIIYLFST